MCSDNLKFIRFVQKYANGAPTVPASPNPQDGSWLNTDILEGELYFDVDTGYAYTRLGNSIINLTVGKPSSNDYSFVVDDSDMVVGSVTELFAWENMAIISVESLNSSSVASIKVNGVAYTLSDLIVKSDTIEITQVAGAVTKFNCRTL